MVETYYDRILHAFASISQMRARARPDHVVLPVWFWYRLEESYNGAIDPFILPEQIKKETEKAILVSLNVRQRRDYLIEEWIPRSILTTPEQFFKVLEERMERINLGAEHHALLIEYAKALNLKPTKRTARETVEGMLSCAKFHVPTIEDLQSWKESQKVVQ